MNPSTLARMPSKAATTTEIVAALERSESVAERETTLSLRSNAATQPENRCERVAWGSLVHIVAAAPARLLLLALRLYQRTVSPVLPVVTLGACGCRFSPSCSHYAAEAIRTHGALAGTGLALARLARCTPLHPGGFDPVPPRSARRPAAPTCHAVRS
jgi:putative membrane protein insertion efficiency factor